MKSVKKFIRQAAQAIHADDARRHYRPKPSALERINVMLVRVAKWVHKKMVESDRLRGRPDTPG